MLFAAIGCRAPKAEKPPGYFGPTEPLEVVAKQINAQVANLPTLRGAGDFEADIVEDGRKHFVNGEITLLYARPDKLRMIGKKDIAGRIFEIGTNAERYWLIVRGETSTMWWGEHGRLASGQDRANMPIRPDLLLEVLGVSSIAPNFLTEPFPVMRFNNDYDVFMITWHTRRPDRVVAQKEVWYDRQSKLPSLVLLFDDSGRVMLSAKLSRHEAVEIKDVPREQWPMVARSYRLFFPDSGTKLSFRLNEVLLQKGGAPRESSFNFPEGDAAGVSSIINVDAQPPR
jgi:hypothetical protein